jgi:hypothetical protein
MRVNVRVELMDQLCHVQKKVMEDVNRVKEEMIKIVKELLMSEDGSTRMGT